MKYRVSWYPPAEEKLAEIWLGSRFARQITEAADNLDFALAQDPHAVGESRQNGVRIAFKSPLAVSFYIDDEKREVIILHVWLF